MISPPFQRRVRHLRLCAPALDTATRASVLFQDALRVASWPKAEGSQLLLIRRLDLGRIPSGGSSASLALQLERRFREVPVEWVGDEGRDYRTAIAVGFAGPAEALTQLARRIARNQPADEWFWPLAVSGWRSGHSGSFAWRVLLEAAHSHAAAALVAAEVLAVAAGANRLTELASTLSEIDAARFCSVCQWRLPPLPSVAPADANAGRPEPNKSRAILGLPRELQARVHRELATIPAPLAVKAWLGALRVVYYRPTLAAVGEIPGQTLEMLGRFHCETEPDGDRPAVKIGSLSGTLPVNSQSPNPAWDSAEALPPEFAGLLTSSRISITGERKSEVKVSTRLPEDSGLPNAELTSPVQNDPVRPFIPPETPRVSTAYGGLLFLVPVLVRLGFTAWLTDRPELLAADFATALFLSLGQRVGLRPDDPLALALLRESSEDSPPLDSLRDSARIWFSNIGTEKSGKLSELPTPESNQQQGLLGESDVTYWRRAVRRWCRLEARIGLATLIRRPARVRASRTHLELVFDLTQTDLQVRRAGLDLDPGWVPWLGRVIQFHYLNPDEHDG